jgi:tetratricopeptide (TPR) repeat protein
MNNLEGVISTLREALALCSHDQSHRPFLKNLAFAYDGRSREAISIYREALNFPHQLPSLNNLANALLARFQQSCEMDDLEEAVSTLRALTLCPHGHPVRFMSLDNLANALSALSCPSGWRI